VQATGFLEHIKLPHYVDFQSELELVRRLRREAAQAADNPVGLERGASPISTSRPSG
jgi:alpha-D-ribose 1-methylphosphonate 5-triphosphate synthase subunit PhnI